MLCLLSKLGHHSRIYFHICCTNTYFVFLSFSDVLFQMVPSHCTSPSLLLLPGLLPICFFKSLSHSQLIMLMKLTVTVLWQCTHLYKANTGMHHDHPGRAFSDNTVEWEIVCRIDIPLCKWLFHSIAVKIKQCSRWMKFVCPVGSDGHLGILCMRTVNTCLYLSIFLYTKSTSHLLSVSFFNALQAILGSKELAEKVSCLK